jgi:riboflavin synthase
VFTGIIQAVGRIGALGPRADDARMLVHAGPLDLGDVAVGDSIAINGVCLTVTALEGPGFWLDVSGETLACTTLGGLRVGDALNLEKALLPTIRLGGHLVAGHVDGVAEVLSRRDEGRSVRFGFRVPGQLARYIAAKGSICLDGVSLTVNAVSGPELGVNIIPHTLQATTMGRLQRGSRVNVEVDLLARYLERLILGHAAGDAGGGISRELLARCGLLERP